ncbi:MAG: hypothetical protein AAFX55_16870, partial [Bacteroidota bacterium]
MKIKLGDMVETIDDAISGRVKSISKDAVTLETADGFEFQFSEDELMVITPKNTLEHAIYDADIEAVKKEKETVKRKAAVSLKPKERHIPKFEVDLHIHKLTDSTKGMTNFDMLNLQLDTARRQLEFAIKKRIPLVESVNLWICKSTSNFGICRSLGFRETAAFLFTVSFSFF